MDQLMKAKEEQERLFPRRLCRVYADMSTPTNQWVEKPITLPEICLELRASINGSADPWDTATIKETVRMLEDRRRLWQHPITQIDQTVYDMVTATILLGIDELEKRKPT